MKTCITLNVLSLTALLTLVLLGTFYKHIPFGAGLGDILIYSLIYLISAVHFLILLIFFIAMRHKKCGVFRTLYTAFMLWVAIYFWLKATIWRGPEYGWYGNLFYVPCPTQFIIITGTDTTHKLGTLCTGDHESTIEGQWTGNIMLVKDAYWDIPEELQEHIRFPIKEAYIRPKYPNTFDPDTLKIDMTYVFKGTITGVKDSVPIVDVVVIEAKSL